MRMCPRRSLHQRTRRRRRRPSHGVQVPVWVAVEHALLLLLSLLLSGQGRNHVHGLVAYALTGRGRTLRSSCTARYGGADDTPAPQPAATQEPPPPQLRIAFVTGNAMKANEMNRILEAHGATCGPTPGTPSLVDLQVLTVDLPEIQEVDTMAIAKSKAILGTQLAGGPCVVEDTSLQFRALGGMPGPYIKWFQERLQSEGLYNILQAYDDKSAVAVCTLAFCPSPHADPVLFTGECAGRIVEPDRTGRYGFGWDSIFVADGCDVPFSQLPVEEKNALSHRGKAVRQWADWLGRNKNALLARQQGATMLGHKGLDFRIDSPEQ